MTLVELEELANASLEAKNKSVFPDRPALVILWAETKITELLPGLKVKELGEKSGKIILAVEARALKQAITRYRLEFK